MKFDLHFVETIDSTNTALKALAKDGAPEGYVLTAGRQTSGRGRLGRAFFSPAGSGLYSSLLLRPKMPIRPAALTCLAAVAAAETVRSYGKDCRIKWVNDLYLDGKKVAGILTEGALDQSGQLRYAIVGIGFDLNVPKNLPASLDPVVGGIFDRPLSASERETFLLRYLERFAGYYERLPEIAFWEAYRDLQIVFGRRVAFSENGTPKSGVAQSVDRDFRLLVCSEGALIPLERGEVTFIAPQEGD